MLTDVEQQVVALCTLLTSQYGNIRSFTAYENTINQGIIDGVITSDEATMLKVHAALRHYNDYKNARLKIVTKDSTRLYMNQVYSAYENGRITFNDKTLLENHKALEKHFYKRPY